MCLDPKDLNAVIHREQQRTSMAEKVATEFAGSRYFTKIYETKAFWCAVIDCDSALCTAFK